jgi:hypothetical protein
MTVHSTDLETLEEGMKTSPVQDTLPTSLPISPGDVEWVADLLDTMRAGDLDDVAESLEAVLTRVRKAAKARQMLATADPELLRDGLMLRARRRDGSS